jgi:hypothetical protein
MDPSKMEQILKEWMAKMDSNQERTNTSLEEMKRERKADKVLRGRE